MFHPNQSPSIAYYKTPSNHPHHRITNFQKRLLASRSFTEKLPISGYVQQLFETEIFNISFSLLNCIVLHSKKEALSLQQEETLSNFR